MKSAAPVPMFRGRPAGCPASRVRLPRLNLIIPVAIQVADPGLAQLI